MSDQQPATQAQAQAPGETQEVIFASPTPVDSGFPQIEQDDRTADGLSSTPADGPPSAAPSASNTPMSAPTPLHAPAAPSITSATSSAAASRKSSVRSQAPPSSSASTTRIRKGLLSRAGSEAEDRIARHASASHQHLTTDDDDDGPIISDSGPMPRRFASQNRGTSSLASASRQNSQSSLSPTARGSAALSSSIYRTAASGSGPYSSSSSLASGNRSGSGDASEGAASIGAASLGRAMSVSSVSSVNSTSSLEAVPFREAPLGNVRLGFGGAGFRANGRNARNSPYGALDLSNEQRSALSPPAQANTQASEQAAAGHVAQESRDGNQAGATLAASDTATASNHLNSSVSGAERHKGVPKPASDAWMYRVGPGMRTSKARAPSAARPEPSEPLFEDSASMSPAKRSRDVLRQKFAKGANRLGIKANIVTGLGPPPSDQLTVYNPLDSSEEDDALIPPSRTPLPRSSSYFTSAPHSANSAAGTPLPSLTPVPADFRTSSVTNAPLFVAKFAEDLQPSRLTPEPLPPSTSSSSGQGQAAFLPATKFGTVADNMTTPYFASTSSRDALSPSYSRRRSSATQRPIFMRAESSNDALDRAASPGLMVSDPSAAGALAGEPALYTRAAPTSSAAPASSAQRAQLAEVTVTPSTPSETTLHPTPAEVVRMEAQAGIASLPDSPSEPSPVPAGYSPVENADAAPYRPPRDSSHSRLRRPSSGTGSEASPSMGATSTRRPESLQRQRLWSNAKRPAILRNRTSENSISRGRRSHSLDRKANSSGPHSPVDGPIEAFDRSGMHSKDSSSSTIQGHELGARAPPHVSVIPEDDDGGNASLDAAQQSDMSTIGRPASHSPRPASTVGSEQLMALSPPNGGTAPYLSRPMPGPRSPSPASQLARSPETIRVGVGRMTDSIYGRSPASISNLRSPRLQPSSASIVSERASTPSPRTTSARGPHDFHFGKTLGEGSYSTVLEAWDLLSGPTPKEPGAVDPNAVSAAAAMVGSDSSRRRRRRMDLTGRKAYAIKVLDKVHILKQGKQKYVSIEKEALSRMIRHPGVVTLFWTFQDRESLYFVLELASNGELLNFIREYGSFDITSARFYAAQLADTIDAMHRAGVVHRDVKPENILLDARRRIKLTDFGTAKIVHAPGQTESQSAPDSAAQPGVAETTPKSQPARAASFVGTAEYVSPELLVEKAQPAGKPADWWAFGCVLFQMLAGRPPFKGVNEYQTLQKVKNRDFTFPKGFPKDAQDLIDRVLVLDPAQRPSAVEIKAHRFFSTIDFDTLWETEAPEINTGLVQPLPALPSRHVGDSSDFSFDEGFGSSDESQAYNGDTQSIEIPSHGGADESSVSLGAVSSAPPDDADASDGSDASSNMRDASQDPSLPRRQSGLQRFADGFQSRFMSNSGGATPNAGGAAAAHRRRFSSMSIDQGNPSFVGENGGANASQAGVRGARPSARSIHTPSTNVSPSPSSSGRAAQTMAIQAAAVVSTGAIQQSWAALLLPKELMLYSLPVAQKKTGAGKMFTKRRQLVLTDFPRLLCVKETATALKVKSEVILAIGSSSGDAGAATSRNASSAAMDAGTASSKAGEFEKISGRQASGNSDAEGEEEEGSACAGGRGSHQTLPNLLTGVDYRGGKTFTLRIANGQTFVYETVSGDAAALVRYIQEARRSAAS